MKGLCLAEARAALEAGFDVFKQVERRCEDGGVDLLDGVVLKFELQIADDLFLFLFRVGFQVGLEALRNARFELKLPQLELGLLV